MSKNKSTEISGGDSNGAVAEASAPARDGAVQPSSEVRSLVERLETQVQRQLVSSLQELGGGLASSMQATSEQLDKLRKELTEQANATGEAQGDYRKVMEGLRRMQEQFESRLSEDALHREIQEHVTGSVEAVEEELSSKIDILEQRYDSLEDIQKLLLIEQEYVEDLIDENQETYQRYKPGHIEVLQQKIDELEQEQENLQEKLTEKNQTLDEKERRIARLLADDDLVEREEIQKKLEELAKREDEVASKEALAAERDELKERLSELEEMREVYEANQEREERNRRDSKQLRELKKEKEQLTERLSELKASKHHHQARAQRLEEQKSRIQEQLKAEKEENSEFQIKVDELKVERDELQNREEEILQVREENLQRQEELDNRESEIERERQTKLKELRDENRKRLATQQKKLELGYREKRDALRDELTNEIKEEFLGKIRSLEEEIKRLKPFKKSYDELSRDYQEVTANQRQWERDRKERELMKQTEEAAIEKALERRQKLEGKLDRLREEVGEAKEETASLRGEKAQIEAELQELDERRKRRRREFEADEESRKQPIYTGIEDFGDCELMTEVGQGGRAESEWLDEIMGSIEDAGFYFPDRLVKAFHTSLKIAEWAPLTVLAGVSGTGKSELPRLYSRYGGLHHQLISVKPNWDSPQDLFGFFNYMDNRYKATDFLKALVQSQQGRDKSGFDDQMLLVLLDEMNLARVELYFSDFLSKLEARRGLEEGDEKYPHIGVDIGSGFDEEQVRLGKNVLFVGTMNEDETTNSLSDKVVDRGNVISFPRPKRLRGRDSQQLPDGRENRLPKETWRRWIVTPNEGLTDETRDEIKEAMNQVNRNFRKVNRAIGHRVLQAIENYVANHPDVRAASDDSDNAWKTALEDQMAQKIMPKLRGVETDTKAGRACLGGIREVLSTYADGLVDDFDQARKTSYGAFRWSSADYLEGGR